MKVRAQKIFGASEGLDGIGAGPEDYVPQKPEQTESTSSKCANTEGEVLGSWWAR